MDILEVGAHPFVGDAGALKVRFGVYLPSITFAKGYEVLVRIIHKSDQFTPEIPPQDYFLTCRDDHPYDLWEATVELTSQPHPANHFGKPGVYLYRYQLRRHGEIVTLWFTDPFARETGVGELAAFHTPDTDPPFVWSDADFRVPPLDDLVVYELQVDEFNNDFAGLIEQLDYLEGLGVNCLELMPITSVRQEFDWGYGPLHFWAPEERYGGKRGFKQLVNACHERGIAVILDSVYEHVEDNFPYARVYRDSGEPNPIIGPFGEGFFGTQIDFAQPFAREYFLECNRYWLREHHVDGFRYDYVPGMYDGPLGQGYAKLVYDTYEDSLAEAQLAARFQDPAGFSRIIQCAEHLPDPRGILRQTFSNCAWQNELLNKVENMAGQRYVDDRFAHLLDTRLIGYPDTRDAEGLAMPVAPFQYFETHDHSRLITRYGLLPPLGGTGDIQYGDRRNFFKLQPFAIALYTCQGIPMLWQGQEFAENYTLPGGGNLRISFRRDIHWEFFYDEQGRALVRLYRILAKLRRQCPALRSRESFYFNEQSRPGDGVIAYLRRTPEDADAQVAVVCLNFSDSPHQIWLPFPSTGTYREQIDAASANPTYDIDVAVAGEFHKVEIPANYGRIYLHGG
ncbi:alpha-amylase family glycosyl hydrolase [Gloeobacter violaceus]|nr:alpha-amylase family glycosyl hydrolase [Gloeobacter violaceus]